MLMQLYGFTTYGINLPPPINLSPMGIVYECSESQSNKCKKSSYDIFSPLLATSSQVVATSLSSHPFSTIFNNIVHTISCVKGIVSC